MRKLLMGVTVALTAFMHSGAYAFTDDFSKDEIPMRCVSDGAKWGEWQVRFAGYGCVAGVKYPASVWLMEAPQASNSSQETHAVLVTGPSFKPPYRFSARSNTQVQLRQGSDPNPWEVGWWIFDYGDRPVASGGEASFYYFMLKPQGWELGKGDGNYRGKQRFLATGASPKLLPGSPAMIEIERTARSDGTDIAVYSSDGGKRQLIVDFTDKEHPYNGGAIGLYNEDAKVLWTDVSAEEQH